MPNFLPTSASPTSRVMMFVDGENLAIRYGALLDGGTPVDHVIYQPNVYVWSHYASRLNGPQEYIRRYYYTSVAGDDLQVADAESKLREVGIEAPRIFRKKKGKRTKRVDITLATDMLTHAHRKNFDIAVLVAGDEDYVPLVEAVGAEGRRVALWFISSGLSPALVAAADHYFDLGAVLFGDRSRSRAFHDIYGP
jgi:uncharacterized LabA/DUF88 family protein